MRGSAQGSHRRNVRGFDRLEGETKIKMLSFIDVNYYSLIRCSLGNGIIYNVLLNKN